MLLECRSLGIAVSDRMLIRELDLDVKPGQLLAILGPNGAGKTLLMQTLAGIRPATCGEVRIQDRTLRDWPTRELARRVALLPQNIEDPFPASVLETVLLGRHPHISRWKWEGPEDLRIARAALAAVGLAGYEQRETLTLSGGERRRAAIAAVLAQAPALFLMDEPTNHLDPGHRLEALQLLRERADNGAGVLVSLHDPNLAARFADRVLLIDGRGDCKLGDTRDTLTAEHLAALFETGFECLERGGRRLFFQA